MIVANNTITVGNKAAVLLTIRVSACGAAQTSFSNTSTLNGTAPNGSAVTDISDLGSDPDLDDDGNPNEVQKVVDLWTFRRDTKSTDPNWLLTKTESEG